MARKLHSLKISSLALAKNPSVARFSAIDEKRGLVLGLVLAPNTTDADGDEISADAITNAMQSWAEGNNTNTITDEHDGPKLQDCKPVSWGQAPADGLSLFGVDQKIPAGAFFVMAEVDEDTMAQIVDGTFTGFSVDGTAEVDDTEIELSAAEFAEVVVSGVKDSIVEPEDEVEVTPQELAQAVVDAVADTL